MSRPTLISETPVSDFNSFYWLKQELMAFCRNNQLSTQGSKQELATRIAAFLVTGKRDALPASPARTSSPAMPTTFTRDTIIGAGWRCSEPLRAFFKFEIGSHFHFNQVIRDFIKHGEGKTLQEAIDAWHQPRTVITIAPQFEYNQFTRDFHATHPQATREEVINAWNTHKSQRRLSPLKLAK